MNSIFKPQFFTLAKGGISKSQIGSDILAGIVVGIIALPLSIAFAVASGVSPEKGIITGVIAGFLISFLGGSRVQIGGPTGAFVVIIWGIHNQYGYEGLFYSTLIAGAILVLFGLFKMGKLLKYIPYPLVVGFTSGIAVVIFTTQVKDALGMAISDVPADFLDKWALYFHSLDKINPAAVAVTAGTILISLGTEKITRRIPGSFLAILVVSALAAILKLPVETIGSQFGEIPNRIALAIPAPDPALIPAYIKSGLIIALLGGIESLLSATVSDGMIGGNHRSNTELIGQGIANMVVPLFGGIPATGAIARTAANVKNGGRTPISGMVHGLTLLSVMLFFGPLVRYIPMACLAGILIIVSYNMSEWRTFRDLLKAHNSDIIVLLVTFFLTVIFDLVLAIEVGVVLSSLLFMKRMSDIAEKRMDYVVDTDLIEDYSELPDGVGVYEISGPLFFATARKYVDLMKEAGIDNRVMIIRMRHVDFIDQTGLRNLHDALEFLHHRSIPVLLSGLNEEVENVLVKSNILDLIPVEQHYSQFREALERAKDMV
ncbi:MAG: SulP family inorganic anion transporter [Spirochaetales bacterium]|nr:SulP family inorganic anion transporter [Spirochaetales bacterium]